MRRLLPLLTLAIFAGCKCDGVKKIKPSIIVTPPALDFGPVKNGDSKNLALTLTAQSASEVQISKIEGKGGTVAGGIEGYTFATDPLTVPSLGTQKLTVTFHPTVLQDYEGRLELTTDDEDHLLVQIPLVGQGAKPHMTVTPDCNPARACTGAVIVSPPSIDFGGEPFMRMMPVDASKLPTVSITNDGDVSLTVTRLEITGADAAAFTIEGGNPAVPLSYDSMAGVNVPIRFRPSSEAQLTYAADLVIESDDPDNASVTVHLAGHLAPNAAPVVCANLTNVTPIDDAPRDYTSLWPQVLVAPVGGYDFTRTRDVEPRSTVKFSAISNATDVTKCTTDPEDGRTGLVYAWSVLISPMGSAPLGMSATSTFTITPVVTGDYLISLSVSDAQGHMTVVPIRFAVALKQDLAVQLQWPGFNDVDLDVHLVRPSSTVPNDPWSGAYSYFNEGPNLKTSGDINGYSNKKLPIWGAGIDFDWGAPGTPDDPKLNIDDTGVGNLLEIASLNYPERDARCDGGRCAYKIFVHYFKDARMQSAPSCFADGGADCSDGEQCACAAGAKCVATPPSDGGRPLGAGECRAAPQPTVRVFLKGDPTPAATIPLPPAQILMGAPCTMLYVADVNWPAQQEIGTLADGGTPPATITDRSDAGFVKFGRRQPGDLRQCSPDVTLTQWYSLVP